MNKIFIAYNFTNKQEAFKINKYLKTCCNDLVSKVMIIKGSHKSNWKKKVNKKIKQSNIFLLLIGEDTHLSDNIDWEIKTAKSNHAKIVCVLLDDEYKIPKILTSDVYEVIGYQNDLIRGQILKKSNLDDDYLEKHLINKNKDINTIFDQYKMMINTSENLIERRSKTNTFFLSANGLLMTALGLLTKAGINNRYSFIYLMSIALIGVILCMSWRSLLISYGQLNRGKFKIVLLLEKYLSASLFSAEWKALAEGKNNKVYRSFTSSEKNIPLIILLIYLVYLMFLVAINILKINKIGGAHVL